MAKQHREKLQKVTHSGQNAFLAAYAYFGVISRAADAAGVSRQGHYRWMETDPKYPALFEQAHKESCEVLETEARRRSVEGLRRYKFHQGAPILIQCSKNDPEGFETTNSKGESVWVKHYYEHEYSDGLLQFLMRGAMPEKYKDRQELTGKDGGPVETRVAGPEGRDAIPEKMARLIQEKLKKRNGE